MTQIGKGSRSSFFALASGLLLLSAGFAPHRCGAHEPRDFTLELDRGTCFTGARVPPSPEGRYRSVDFRQVTPDVSSGMRLRAERGAAYVADLCESFESRPISEAQSETCRGDVWGGGVARLGFIDRAAHPDDPRALVTIIAVGCLRSVRCEVTEAEYYAFEGSSSRPNGRLIPTRCK